MTNEEFQLRVAAIASAGEAWRDPEYPVRSRAVSKTLEIPDNSFTQEAVAFAVNQQMSLLTSDGLAAWLAGRRAHSPQTIGVLNAGNIPLVGLQDLLAVLLTGHRYIGSVSSKSPALLPAFASEVSTRHGGLELDFVESDELFDRADAIIATGSDETGRWVRDQAAAHHITQERLLIRGHRFAAAVLNGNETDEAYERLAEDALLHEGFGCRNVSVIWAPSGLSPDGFLDALARFRGIFPAHESTPRRLKIQQAFLEAMDVSHAYGDGLEFLVSKGEPEPQQPGHVRWAEYGKPRDVIEWLDLNAEHIQVVTTDSDLVQARRDTDAYPSKPGFTVEPLGNAQRPPLSWRPDGIDTVGFLSKLS